MDKYDLIVIGGGPAGIAHAIGASRKGARVKLLEARARLGGRLGAGEDWAGAAPPAFRAMAASSEVATLRGIGIDTDELGWRPTQHITAIGAAGEVLTLPAERALAHRAAAARTPFEAERWDGFCAFLARASSALKASEDEPRPKGRNSRTLPAGANDLVRKLNRPREELAEIMRLATTPMRALLEGVLSDSLLQAALAGPALFGGTMMPGAAGSGFLLADAPILRGSEARLDLGFTREAAPAAADLLMACLRDAGIDFEIGVGVSGITVEKGTVTGVALSDGRQLASSQIISTLDLKATVLGLVDWKHLPDAMVREVSVLQMPGAIGRFMAVTNHLPEGFEALGAGAVYLNTAPALADHAANTWRMDRVPEHPPFEVAMMHLPDGRGLLTALCHYLPLNPLGQAWTRQNAEAVFAALCEGLAPLWPQAREAVSDWRFESPADLEARFGWSHGSPFGVEPTIAHRLGAGTGLEARLTEHLQGLCFGGDTSASVASATAPASARPVRVDA